MSSLFIPSPHSSCCSSQDISAFVQAALPRKFLSSSKLLLLENIFLLPRSLLLIRNVFLSFLLFLPENAFLRFVATLRNSFVAAPLRKCVSPFSLLLLGNVFLLSHCSSRLLSGNVSYSSLLFTIYSSSLTFHCFFMKISIIL
jgi:hypothetical protein